jgi:RNA-directed DNA polymerase
VTRTPISPQDLRRRIYAKAKAEPSWRFWGLYVHVCKMETLREAYALAKANDGAPGIDGVTFADIDRDGIEGFLGRIRDELAARTYRPMRNRRKEIPKAGGRVRVLGIPSIRDRVVQGALKLILEPIFEADFQPGSYGYRPGRSAHEAVERVRTAISQDKTRVIDLDLKGYFDNVRHSILLDRVARRVQDPEVMRLLRMILKATGKQGVPQGGVISPLLSNIYLNDVDRMLERAREVTREGRFTRVDYARFADDMVILVDADPRHGRLFRQVNRRLREELDRLCVEINEEKSRTVDLRAGESFGFLGFDLRRVRTRAGGYAPLATPRIKKRTELLGRLKQAFRQNRSQPVRRVIVVINPMIRGWVNYFAHGNAGRCFTFIRDWVEKKVRRHMLRSQKRKGFGWNRWSRRWLYSRLGLFDDYRVLRGQPQQKALPA